MSDAIGNLANTIRGKQAQRQEVESDEKNRKRSVLMNAMGGMTYAQKRQLLEANPELSGLVLPEIDNADDAKDREIHRILTTPDEQLHEHERVIKYHALGASTGEIGSTALVNQAYGGTPAAKDAVDIKTGRKMTATETANLGETRDYHGKTINERKRLDDSYIKRNVEQATSATESAENKRQQRDPNSPYEQTRVATRKPAKPEPDKQLNDYNGKLRKLSTAEEKAIAALNTTTAALNAETDSKKKEALAKKLAGVKAGLATVRGELKTWIQRRDTHVKQRGEAPLAAPQHFEFDPKSGQMRPISAPPVGGDDENDN